MQRDGPGIAGARRDRRMSATVEAMRHVLLLFLVVVGAGLAAACSGDDDGAALPSVPTSAVPRAEPAVGTDQPVTLVDENCLRADDLTLVFVTGQAEMRDVGTEQRLEVRSTAADGGAGLASVPVGALTGVPVLGHHVEPTEWATEPPDGCEGPYFLVTGFDVQPG